MGVVRGGAIDAVKRKRPEANTPERVHHAPAYLRDFK